MEVSDAHAQTVETTLRQCHSRYFGDGVGQQRCERALDAHHALVERMLELKAALRAIQANAEAWHGPLLESRHAAALTVIARWAHDPASIPQAVMEHARTALVVEGEAL